MGLDSLSKPGEFVGGFSVVVSLFHLSYWLRQNTKSMLSENYACLLQHIAPGRPGVVGLSAVE